MTTEILKYFDLFGNKISFYINKKYRFYTTFGGVLSIIIIILGLMLFHDLSIDDFKLKNPIMLKSEFEVFPQRSNLSIEQIYIPFRIISYFENDKNISNIFEPVISYIFKEINNSLVQKEIGYKKCSESLMKNISQDIYNIKNDLNNLYCINLEKIYLEDKSLFEDDLNHIQIDIYLKENNEGNISLNQDLISFNKNNKTNINSIYLQYLYPLIYIKPKNFKNPVNILYLTRDYYIHKNTQKKEKIYLRENIISDTYGLFWRKKQNHSYWSTQSFTSDDYYINNNLDNESKENNIFSLSIYLDKGYNYYERRFNNFYQTFSKSIPFITVIYTICKILIKIINISSINNELYNMLFISSYKNDFNNNHFLIPQLKLKMKNNKDLSQSKRHYSKDGVKFKKGNKLILSQITPIMNKRDPRKSSKFYSSQNLLETSIYVGDKIGFNEISKKNNKLSIINEVNPKNSYKIKNKNKNISSEFLELEQKRNNLIKNKEVVKNNQQNITCFSKTSSFQKLFPFRFYLISSFLKNIEISKVKFFISKKFINVYNFMTNIYDIKSYIILHNQFNKLKILLTNEKQKHLIESDIKININEDEFENEELFSNYKDQFDIYKKNNYSNT